MNSKYFALNEHKKECNSLPVHYCKKCLSLRIRGIGDTVDFDYCDECGATCTDSCSIEEWETMYTEKFGHKYLEDYYN